MSTKEAYQQRLEAQLNEWNAQIERLKTKAEQAEADARIEYSQQIEKLQAMRESARERLDELEQAGEGAWQDLKDGIEGAWTKLGESIKAASSRFK